MVRRTGQIVFADALTPCTACTYTSGKSLPRGWRPQAPARRSRAAAASFESEARCAGRRRLPPPLRPSSPGHRHRRAQQGVVAAEAAPQRAHEVVLRPAADARIRVGCQIGRPDWRAVRRHQRRAPAEESGRNAPADRRPHGASPPSGICSNRCDGARDTGRTRRDWWRAERRPRTAGYGFGLNNRWAIVLPRSDGRAGVVGFGTARTSGLSGPEECDEGEQVAIAEPGERRHRRREPSVVRHAGADNAPRSLSARRPIPCSDCVMFAEANVPKITAVAQRRAAERARRGIVVAGLAHHQREPASLGDVGGSRVSDAEGDGLRRVPAGAARARCTRARRPPRRRMRRPRRTAI